MEKFFLQKLLTDNGINIVGAIMSFESLRRTIVNEKRAKTQETIKKDWNNLSEAQKNHLTEKAVSKMKETKIKSCQYKL